MSTIAVPDAVSPEYREAALRYFPQLLLREQYAANIFGYWAAKIPLDPELDRLRFKTIKSSYDEVRHRELCAKMVKRFGGQAAVDEMHASWEPWDNWQQRMTTVFTDGLSDYVEFLTTVPLIGDRAGLFIFQDFAECSPDPVWADAAESVVADEQLHISLADEFLPLVVERHGEAARAKIERHLDTWLPFLFGLQGHPEHDAEGRQRLIDAGFMTLTVEDLHDILYEELRAVMDPIGVDVPAYSDLELLSAGEVDEYAERVFLNRAVAGDPFDDAW